MLQVFTGCEFCLPSVNQGEVWFGVSDRKGKYSFRAVDNGFRLCSCQQIASVGTQGDTQLTACARNVETAWVLCMDLVWRWFHCLSYSIACHRNIPMVLGNVLQCCVQQSVFFSESRFQPHLKFFLIILKKNDYLIYTHAICEQKSKFASKAVTALLTLLDPEVERRLLDTGLDSGPWVLYVGEQFFLFFLN